LAKDSTLRGLVHFVLFTVVSSVLVCLTYCMLFVARALTVIVDTFGCRIADSPNLPEVTHQWNLLQAVVRKSSGTIERCFVALMVTAVVMIPALIADLFVLTLDRAAVLNLLPGTVVTVGIFRMIFLAAAVTDKCIRVPALVNALHFGPGTDRMKQHIVEYIVNSAAGFYVCDVRMTTEMTLKFMYTWSIVVFGISTTVFSTN